MFSIIINRDSVDILMIDELKRNLRSIDNDLDQPHGSLTDSEILTLENKRKQIVNKLVKLDAYDYRDTYDFIVYCRVRGPHE